MAEESKPLTREAPIANPGRKDSELTQELDWLSDSSLHAQIDLAHAVRDALELIQPLLAQSKARVSVPETISGLLMAHPVAFQQVLLSLLYFSIRICGENEVKLELIPQLGRQEIQVTGIRSEQTVQGEGEEQRLLETLRQLVDMSQGRFTYHPTGAIFRAVVSFDAVELVPVLVIDDNPEIITLMQRFTVNTPYRIHGVSEPRLAIAQALKVLPKIIVLDIMMPQVDGLQVLSWFKHHPNLGHIPVIVCSVMPQKDLADSLGASGFISKPILRESLIAVLDTTIEREVR
jgi:CheY-like chemotaxis protein